MADRKKIELQAVGDERDIAVKTTGLAMALARSGRLDEAGYTTRFTAGRALPMARSS